LEIVKKKKSPNKVQCTQEKKNFSWACSSLSLRLYLCFCGQIGVLIEDKEMLTSSMNGKLYKAGKFTRSLRIALWAEHLGLRGSEVCKIFFHLSFNVT
jgi:hypothetical protein